MRRESPCQNRQNFFAEGLVDPEAVVAGVPPAVARLNRDDQTSMHQQTQRVRSHLPKDPN